MIVKNTESEVFVIAEIPPAGPIVKLNVKSTLEQAIKIPLQEPINKLNLINECETFQYITQKTK